MTFNFVKCSGFHEKKNCSYVKSVNYILDIFIIYEYCLFNLDDGSRLVLN